MIKNLIKYLLLTSLITTFFISCSSDSKNKRIDKILLQDVTLIDGLGGEPKKNVDVLIAGDSIVEIGKKLDPEGAKVISLKGKTVMPALISDHVHVGTLKGTSNNAVFYTRENILNQLKKYEDYGVLNVVSMGSDRPMIFENGFRDSSSLGELPGARLHSAGYGFGMVDGAPPLEFAMDKVFRPTTIDEIPSQMDTLKKIKPDFVKLWVDDFNGKYPKRMNPEIYNAIINEAHKRNLRVAAHVYYLQDAKKLVADGVDVIGHSVRDSLISDALVKEMKSKNIAYIPTLSLDEFAYIYARKPEWVKDEFFKNSLEPDVYEMITSEKFQNNLKNSPAFEKNIRAFEIALSNVKILYDAGILIALGTDSGAMALRAQGFSEHLELELLVQAGIPPLQAIKIGTYNAAKVLGIDHKFGTLEKGKVADLIVLNQSPMDDIKNTRTIFSVYKSGKEVSKGPLNKQ